MIIRGSIDWARRLAMPALAICATATAVQPAGAGPLQRSAAVRCSAAWGDKSEDDRPTRAYMTSVFVYGDPVALPQGARITYTLGVNKVAPVAGQSLTYTFDGVLNQPVPKGGSWRQSDLGNAYDTCTAVARWTLDPPVYRRNMLSPPLSGRRPAVVKGN